MNHDAKLILVLGCLALSAMAFQYGAEWVLYWTRPSKAAFPFQIVGLAFTLAALAWTLFVVYIWLRVLWNSFT